jgi:hypothetical protein
MSFKHDGKKSHQWQQWLTAYRRGETEYWFPEVVFRFAANKLFEVSFQTPEQLEINGECIAPGASRSHMLVP